MQLFKEVILTGTEHHRSFAVDIRWNTTQERKPLIIFVHGFKGFKDWGTFPLIADQFVENDFIFIKLNLSHNGVTPDSPMDYADLNAFSENTFSKELQDIQQVVDFVKSNRFPVPEDEADKDKVLMLGHSRGAAAALLHTAMDSRISGVCGWGAVVDLESRWPKPLLNEWKSKGVVHIPNSRTGQDMPMKYDIVEDYFANRDDYHIPSALARISVPVLLIHGTDDETVPLEETASVVNELPEIDIAIIDGANHVFGGSHPYTKAELPVHTMEMVQKTIQFFKTNE